MSVRLSHRSTLPEDDSGSEEGTASSEEDNEEETWDDWVSDSMEQRPCRSLFEDKLLPSVEEALAYDKGTHGFDLDGFCVQLSLDTYRRIRLINFIRKTNPTPAAVGALTGTEELFSSDEYLHPVMEDDPLLQIQPEDWSDSDGDDTDPAKRIIALEKRLSAAKQDLADYRALVNKQLDISTLIAAVNEPSHSTQTPPARDDDSHYFQSYEANDIHAVMIQDQVRTSTYAHFILTNPSLFRDAVVLDVGCGTGILSLFAAKAGAKRVFAVDASDIAEKAEKIVKANDLESIITVIRGKVEDITLPDGIEKVDVIISEWMGYALLYESMLDSVLRARDRFLSPGGVMAPSQSQMLLALCDASEVSKDRVDFWNDVYGFDLSIMAHDLYDEAIVDVVGPQTLLSAPDTVKDLHLGVITPRQLDFVSSFKLVSTVERRTKVNSFILYFDTFFTANGRPVPEGTEVKVIREGDPVVAEVWPVGGRPAPQRRTSSSFGKQLEAPKITSFSTGPQSIPTHWKQTLFLLREPFIINEGSTVTGHFHCVKSKTNSRELDVEIHYSVRNEGETQDGATTVQMYKVR
ncbi:protein arginine N-methyltransferase [Mycena sanguinolenta]|nr:protein arginine N-methyltransferase [Mycena sanguinolenta]